MSPATDQTPSGMPIITGAAARRRNKIQETQLKQALLNPFAIINEDHHV
ncbi:MAG: hypothetical protein V4488_05715 [Pseudomonadota bacterium]